VSIAAIFHYSAAADVVTAVSPVTGVIAALVGAYFGVRGATLAQQKANEGLQSLRAPAPGVIAPDGTDGGGSPAPAARPSIGT
jgi:hypothetical protein